MEVFVIAQHHGVLLTLNSLLDSGIKDISVVVPQSQVYKYNQMYESNLDNPDYVVFKDFDRRIKKFADLAEVERGSKIRVFTSESFDVRNTVCSMLETLNQLDVTGKVSCHMAGSITLKDYRDSAEAALRNTFGFCYTRVYNKDRRLGMYSMLGLPKVDNSLDINFFLIDMDKISPKHLIEQDRQLLVTAQKEKEITYLPRPFNYKDDILIGTAISARESVCHGLRASRGFNLSFWNKVMQPLDKQKPEEVFAYPYDIYAKYAFLAKEHLPGSTVNKIMENGKNTEMYAKNLRTCIDIIDLINT